MELNNYKIERLSKYNHRIKYLSNDLNKKNSQSAIFFDRDGVLIQDSHYISNPNKIELLPGVKEILKSSHKAGWLNIVVTNQSGIIKRKLNWQDYNEINFKMLSLLGKYCDINCIIANSENPNFKNFWRKPSPEMLLFASSKFKIDFSKSIMIGDRLSDLEAGANAKIKNLIHVLTGHGQKERETIDSLINKKRFTKYKYNHEVHLINNLNNFPFELLKK